MDNTWEITMIIEHYNEKMKGLDSFSEEAEEIQELYAQALRIQCGEDCGYIMTVDDFIEEVRIGSFVDYDGSGVFADWEGNRKEYIRCDVNWLQENRKDYPFVKWFNK